MGKVLPFEKPQKPRGAPTCKSCAHLYGRGTFARCGAVGLYADISRNLEHRCGSEGKFWTPKPASFLKRLGDALVDRVKGGAT